MTSSEHEVYYLDHGGGGYNYGVPSSEVSGGHLQITPKLKKKRTLGSRIKVCVRKRPLSKREKKRETDVVQVDDDGHQLLVEEEKLAVDLRKVWLVHKFQFDEIFGEDISNKGVYERTAKQFLPFVLKGGKATCFAFGQTGAGKTHTLLGDRNGKGLFQFAAEDLFECLRAEAECDGVVLWVSYFEIYCGQLYDLLNKRERIQALENGKHQVCITGVNEVPVNGPQALNQFVEQGNSLRSQGSSGVNTSSSRSHAVLQMQLKDVTGNKLGRLSFIDLAGSERACDRGEPDKTTRLEGAEINTSLLALKECIRAMDQEHTYTPFRQSKLTQVLRDSFLGESLTCMVASISPGSSALEHTLNTLRYADRVKEIHKLAYNSHQFSSAPKSFTPNNTSTPLKPQKNLRTSSLTPRRTSLPAQNLHMASTAAIVGKRRSSMQTHSPRSHGTLEGKLGSKSEGSPRRKVKQGSKINLSDGGREMDKNLREEDQSYDERKGRNLLEQSPAIHREVVDGEAVKIRSNILRQSQHQEKHMNTSHMLEELKESYVNGEGRKLDKERALREEETGEEKLSGDGEWVEEKDEKIKRKKMVQSFLSNSLPVWEDERVIEKAIPSPNLSTAWEIENPHFIETKESLRTEGEKEEQEINNNFIEVDVMRFENPRYVGRKSSPQFEFTEVEEKFEEGRNVESQQSFQSLTDHFVRREISDYVTKDNGRGPSHDQKGEEREAAGSPRSIATDSTMELLAEIDQSLRNSSVSPVPDLARRYTLDGMSHGDLWKDVNRLKVSSSFTEKVQKVTLSTEYQQSITKTKMKKKKESVFHQKKEMLRKVSPDMEKEYRGNPSMDNLQRKGTEGNEDEPKVKDVSRKEPVGESSDAERNEKRSGGKDGRGGARNGPLLNGEQRESKNGQERKGAGRKAEEKMGEMKEGYDRFSKDAGREMKQYYVVEDRDAGINHEPQKESLNGLSSDQHLRYSYLYQYESSKNEIRTSHDGVPHSKTNDSEGSTDKVGGGLKGDVHTGAAKEKVVGNRGVFIKEYDRDNRNDVHQGMEVHRGSHRSHRTPDGDTKVQRPVGGFDGEQPTDENSKRHEMNKEGNVENGSRNSKESGVRDEKGSGKFVVQNNPQNHEVQNMNGGKSSIHFKDISAENGNEQVVEVLSGRHHFQHESQYKEEITNQSQNRNNSTKRERKLKEPKDKSIMKVDTGKSKTTQHDVEPKGNELSIVQNFRLSDKVDLGGEVVSEGDKDLKLSHKFHSTGEWCECCSVLEQNQLWNREGAEKPEEEMKERLGLKEERVMDHRRRASLNQRSESPSRRRKNLKQRNSLPWIGAPRFENQEDLSGKGGDSEFVEHVIRRRQCAGEDGTKDYDNSAKVFTSSLTIECVSKLQVGGKETKTVGTPDRQEMPKKKGSLVKESLGAGESDSLRNERHVTFKDVSKRGKEVREQQHHPLPSVVVTPDDKNRKSPRYDEKEKPSSPDLTVYSTGGYIPTVFAVAQNNASMMQLNNNLSKSGKKKKKKSLKEKMSEKGIESLPSPKGFPLKTEMAKSFEEGITRSEVSQSEISSNSKAITTWAESAERRQKSDRKEERESFFLWDVETENSMTSGTQSNESVRQQVAFYRETYQPLSNQWQHVRNDGRSPVVKVKLSAGSVSRDSDENEEVSGVLIDRSNVITDTGITKNHINGVAGDDQNRVSHDLDKQEDGWMHSRERLKEIRNSGDGVTQGKQKRSETVENDVGKDWGGGGSRDEHVTHQRLDFVEEERIQSRRKRECKDSRQFEERDEVPSKRNGKEPSKRKEEEHGYEDMTDDVTDLHDGDMEMSKVKNKFSERQESNELLVQESNSSTQQIIGVTNLDIDSSWVSHQPLSPIPESRSDEDDDVRGRLTNGAVEDHIRPNSALEKATKHSSLSSRHMVLKDRHLLVRAHQEQLEELQQLCDSGWNLINKLQLGQGDVYEYLSDSDVLLDSQERCIKTFKDQLAMYTSCSSPAGMMMNGMVEHTNRRS